MSDLPNIHPMALAIVTLGAAALLGFVLQCVWFLVLKPICRWLGE